MTIGDCPGRRLHRPHVAVRSFRLRYCSRSLTAWHLALVPLLGLGCLVAVRTGEASRHTRCCRSSSASGAAGYRFMLHRLHADTARCTWSCECLSVPCCCTQRSRLLRESAWPPPAAR
ncbi:hypothetical protein HBB16_11485 [Pseudonocardia sp. MCCB 268]|nr:hypothetical protein [Pseudonocardia cytotoxica]